MLLVLSAIAPASAAVGAASAQTADALDCEFPYTGTDATGTDVTVSEEPERVVTLSPSAAQTMWEVGGSEKVVGVSQFAGYLDGAGDLPVALSGYPATVNTEKVIELQPDLVLAPNTIDNESVQKIRGAGITVYRFELADSVDSVTEKTELVGELTGECSGAEQVVSGMEERVNTIETAVEGEEKPTVYWGTEAGYTAGPNTFIGKAIAKAGGHNIAADADASAPYPQLTAEFIAAQDPDFVVVSVSPERMGNESKSYIPKGSVIRNTTAYEEGNIVVVNTNNLSQPAPRVVTPMTTFAQAFHPEAYADANTTTTTQTTSEPTATTSDQTSEATTADTTTSNGDTPGFGAPVALVAVLAAALIARR
ncbi:PGF-CTERM-anchored ABC transporter substrate-binding protein [Halobacterium litoreum]|uniref:PGF-CTERM-anchored ABC transporter substrate-binding protein n=1 Tax=Halobacterium litoreum TaxID=2039234 RepID=A0ABD5NB48_9EURY|nr:PGF-CTERM-anchored ABC transporter substrate-binding protein [Halobacterium litoreum]UHH14611.1 PGF-CTERM-anchored ABC transporter substrate-binding protein [Halobacterium litoreum]